MTSPIDSANRWAVLGLVIMTMTVLGLILDETPALALVNESSSLPKGVYTRRLGAPLERDSVVAIPQPLAARGYLAGLGMDADVLLIKRVAAVGGEVVCRSGDRVVVPGDRAVTILGRDRRGVVMPVWSECRRLGPEEIFLLGDTATSFDSRYFGPVRRSTVTGVFKEVVSW